MLPLSLQIWLRPSFAISVMIIIWISVIPVLKTFCLIVETSIWESNRRGKNRTRLSISIDCFHWRRILSFLTLGILLKNLFDFCSIAVLIAICFQYPGVGNESRKVQIFKIVRSYFTSVHFVNSTFNFCKSKIYLGVGEGGLLLLFYNSIIIVLLF